jgi:hypothetical protein
MRTTKLSLAIAAAIAAFTIAAILPDYDAKTIISGKSKGRR